VELLLGRQRFGSELAGGAFFLLEDWAVRWNYVSSRSFGQRPDIMRDVFQQAHTHLLAIRTPCSGDFRQQAAVVSEAVGLPLQWRDVDLAHLERTLRRSMDNALQGC
jgi:hypothetical protein